MHELEPCPFCKGKAETDNADTCASTWIICTACGARSGACASYDEAVLLWNRRAKPNLEGIEDLRVSLDLMDKAAGGMSTTYHWTTVSRMREVSRKTRSLLDRITATSGADNAVSSERS